MCGLEGHKQHFIFVLLSYEGAIIPSCVQGLVLALHSGIFSGVIGESYVLLGMKELYYIFGPTNNAFQITYLSRELI